MSERMIFDKRTGGWIRGTVDQSGVIQQSNGIETKEKTVESIWLMAGIRNADSNETGISDDAFIKALNGIGEVDELHVFIDSNGGHTVAMANMLDALQKHPAKKKITHGIGKMFSAAGAIFLLGDERLITPGSCLMLHNAHTYGDDTTTRGVSYSELVCDLFPERMPGIDRATIREWQHRETYFDCASATGLGLATGIDFQSQVRVGIDASGCNQPEPITDFWATRAFAAKLAKKAKPVVPPKVPRPIKITNQRLRGRERGEQLKAWFERTGVTVETVNRMMARRARNFAAGIPNHPLSEAFDLLERSAIARKTRTGRDWASLGLSNPPQGCFTDATDAAFFLNRRRQVIASTCNCGPRSSLSDEHLMRVMRGFQNYEADCALRAVVCSSDTFWFGL